MNNLRKYWLSLSPEQRQKFADSSVLSAEYINTHLIHRRKIPSLSAIKRLADASNGNLDYHELCDFFVESNKDLEHG